MTQQLRNSPQADHDVANGAAFLRWAGGKRWLVPQVLQLTRDRAYARYHEPFLGGGSVFFALPEVEAHLWDLNADLIEVYEEVASNPSGVAAKLAQYENTADAYYEVRGLRPRTAGERAARFIYLNHTSYNGIFRVNLKGEYNVPFGFRPSPNFPDEAELSRASEKLKRATLTAGDFADALSNVHKGDLVFLDPPYTVAHNNNGFVKYNQHLFSFEDQVRLAHALEKVVAVGASFILTNAAHKSIHDLFSPLGRVTTIVRRNSVGGKNAARGKAEELMFTNIEESHA